jgi:hypothetical protein
VCRLSLEGLEDRTLLSGSPLQTATTLAFQHGTAQATGFLAAPRAVDLYRVDLDEGDTVHAAITAQTAGSGLRSLLRVFNDQGTPLALDDREGGDPSLTFQAATTSTYYIGVSSAPNNSYDPSVAESGQEGGTTGLYTLELWDRAGARLLPDLAGASFRLGTDTAFWGDSVPLTFTVENRGAAAAVPFDVEVVISPYNDFDPDYSEVLQTFTVPGLGTGQGFTRDSVPVTLPDAETIQQLGWPNLGPVFLGLRIDPQDTVAESNPFNQSGVHRGADWERLWVLPLAEAAGTNDTLATAQIIGASAYQVSGTLPTVNSVAWYQFTLVSGGQMTAAVGPTSAQGLATRLALYGSARELLAQSDGDGGGESPVRIEQYLQAGLYFLAVSALAGTGSYVLTLTTKAGNQPGSPLDVGWSPGAVATGDLYGNGWNDLVVANQSDVTVSVLLNNGDGTFTVQDTPQVGQNPSAVALADVDGNGKQDLIVANAGDWTVSVLRGSGDGTFQAQHTFVVGSSPAAVALADANGDGKPDIVVANADDNTVSVLRNTTAPGASAPGFASQQTFATGSSPASVALGDFNEDGLADIAVANQGDGTVSVLLGNGDGTFQEQVPYQVGSEPVSVAAADVDGDGHPDLVVANRSEGNVSVLLGNGDGTFQDEEIFLAGSQPQSVKVADVNGDGRPDLAVANYLSNTLSILLGNGNGTFLT